MKIQVRYFAALREALGTGESLDVPAGITVQQLRELLAARGGPHARMLAPDRAVRVALNHAMCDGTVAVDEGAEVAFFPPVTGG